MAPHLTVIEEHAQGIGEHADHSQQDQRTGLMDGGLFETGLGGKGLKHFRVHPPAAAAQFMDEARRDGTTSAWMMLPFLSALPWQVSCMLRVPAKDSIRWRDWAISAGAEE